MSKPLFGKVLVANRGEIAVRVIRTLREMGIRSVAVYSEPDRDALHVRMADEAYALGGVTSAESYLVGSRILEVCRKAGASAIHPGYGFLSENAAFVRECQSAGVVFIGPSPEAMEAMGSKTAAREKMIAAGVPVVPGDNAGNADDLAKSAASLGFPVMLKASAGGGGKGMRFVERPEDLALAYERACSEALAAFGDATVYIEKAIVRPRHVEIQVLADRAGNTVHLFERDCSIQRRHQKVVEEAPSPASNEALIAEMGAVAVRAAEAVSYEGAGTIEFLLSETGEFYFLEMNTRLQVEHPVTELITGIDLVREQVRVAAGEDLGYGQSDLSKRGHAIECRIYAEDPAMGFMPSPGTIHTMRTPAGPGVRDDAGAYEGVEITPHYDPLISKLSVWAATREQAVERMERALREYVVAGIATNIPFHLQLMQHPDFRSGKYDTGFIAEHEDVLLKSRAKADGDVLALASAIHQGFQDAAQAKGANVATSGTPAMTPWRLGALTRP